MSLPAHLQAHFHRWLNNHWRKLSFTFHREVWLPHINQRIQLDWVAAETASQAYLIMELKYYVSEYLKANPLE